MASSTVRIEMPVKAIDNMNEGLNQMTENLNKIERAIMKASSQVENAGKSMAGFFHEASEQVSQFDKEIEKSQRDFMRMARERYQIVLEAVDHTSLILASIRTGLQGIMGKTWTVTVKAVDQTAEPIRKILRSLKIPAMQTDKLFETGNSMQTSINAFMSLQTAINKVKMASIEMGKSLDISNVANGANGFGETVSGFVSDVLSGTISDLIASNIGASFKSIATFDFLEGTGMSTLAQLGLKVGAGAKTGTGLALAGLGVTAATVTGGVAAASGLVIGTSDALTATAAYKEGDSKKGDAYSAAAAAEIGGTAAGALTGAIIGASMGSAVPILGTIIGAGVGAIVGIIGGKAIKGQYEKEAEAAKQERIAQEEKERQDAISAAQGKYKTDVMKTAVKDLVDGAITAEQASRIFTEQVNKGLRNHFGDTELSLERISKIAQRLVFGDYVKEFERFEQATAETEKSMERLAENGAALDRIGSKVKLNIELTNEEKEIVKTGTKEFMDNALETVMNQELETNAAINLIFGEGGNEELKDMSDKVHENRREQVGSKGTDLIEETNNAILNGTWNPDVDQEKREGIENIVNMGAGSGKERQLDLLEISHGGSGMTYESFAKIQEGMQPYREQIEQEIYAAGETLLDTLYADREMRKGSDNEMKLLEVDARKRQIQEGVQGKIRESNVQWEGDQLGVIANAYQKELPSILGDVEGSDLTEKLGTVLHDAIALGMDPSVLATGEGFLGVLQERGIGNGEGESELQGELANMLSGVLNTLSSEYIKELAMQDPSYKSGINEIPEWAAIALGLLPIPFPLGLDQENGQSFSTLDTLTPSATEAAGQASYFYDGGGAVSTVGGYDGFADQGDSYGVSTTIVPGIADGIANTDMGSINDAINTLKENVQAAIDSAFSAGFETSTSVRINANYSLTGGLSVPGSITTNPALQYRPHANGDIVNGPQFSLIGEDGPEAIIPLGSKRRDRGLSLWQQAGELLGVGRYADGGILSGDSGGVKTYLPSGDSGSSLPDQGDGSGINVSVNMSPTFEINNDQTSGENGVVSTLKSHIRDMTDEVADELAVRLQKIFGNMPTKEA